MNAACLTPRSAWCWATGLTLMVFLATPTLAAEPARTSANVPVEIPFTAQAEHADPFNKTFLDVTFRSPSGREAKVPAFWAGGKTWKVRYASGEVGEHRFRSACNLDADAGLHAVEGVVTVAPYTGDNPLFKHGPIRVADDRRHMAHADGTPFFWLGDTWWMGLAHRLHFPDEFGRLAADRKAKGFNVVQIVAGLYPDMPPFDPRGANEAGFPWEAEYARIRPGYFDAADKRLQHLVDQGITPCLVGAWGYFLPYMGVERAEQHWRYLIARYGAYPIAWCVAGEANLPYYQVKNFPYDDREQVHGWTKVIAYVRATDPFRRPLTIHPTAINQYTARHATDDPALLDFDMLQTPHGNREAIPITLKAARDSYAAAPTMPVIDGEAAYEMLSGTIPASATRAMFWTCMASGAAGHTYGANGIWQNNRKGDPHGKSPTGGTYGTIAWDESMVLPGSAQLAAGKRFLERFDWPKSAPHPEWVAWDTEAGPRPPSLGRWIWSPESDATQNAAVGARFFRRAFDLPAEAKVKHARLRVGADNSYTVWLNGKEVGAGIAWLDLPVLDVSAALRPGRNVLAIRAENAPGPEGHNPAGLIAGLEVEVDGRPAIRVGSDKDWRVSLTEVAHWRDVDFADDEWPAALDMGPAGIAPWGEFRAPESQPPLALGIPDGFRVFYMLDPKPVVLRGLEPGRPYQALEFDPDAGTTRDAGILKADASGQARHARPAHGHDWVLGLTPTTSRAAAR